MIKHRPVIHRSFRARYRAGARALLLAGGLLACSAAGVQASRFPQPEFETGHTLPVTRTPPARPSFWLAADVVLLAAAIGAAGYLTLRRRSRRGMAVLTLAALAFFGFWRRGCVCPVGSVQNVAAALADPAFSIGWATILFFLLPLLAALFIGRAFCGAVCPLGALQDVVVLKPLRLPPGLQRALRIVPGLLLGLAVLFAAGGADFWICRLDPFVPIFRLHGEWYMLAAGGLLLLLGVWVARPYCRFLCPYGVLLGWAARLSRRRVSITPDECIQCRLCENACPFGAIRAPTPEKIPESRSRGMLRLGVMLAAWPLLAGAGWLAGDLAAPWMARVHPEVRLAEQVAAEDAGRAAGSTLASDAFRSTGTLNEELYAAAADRQRFFRSGGRWFGLYAGLLAGAHLTALSLRRRRTDYDPDPVHCLSCGRCFDSCPKEHARRAALLASSSPRGRS